MGVPPPRARYMGAQQSEEIVRRTLRKSSTYDTYAATQKQTNRKGENFSVYVKCFYGNNFARGLKYGLPSNTEL